MAQVASHSSQMTIYRQIKILRKKIGLTQIEFAKRAGVGLRFLRELEQGKTTIRMDKLIQVLQFLGYHLEIKKSNPQYNTNED
jgi:y4mF family transcriptional regulator